MKISHALRQVGGFLRVSSSNKTDCHDIAAILLKVTLNTITPNPINIDLFVYTSNNLALLKVVSWIPTCDEVHPVQPDVLEVLFL